MPMPDSKSDFVHFTKSYISVHSSSLNVKEDCCFPCVRKWSFVFDDISVDQTEIPCSCSSRRAEAGKYTVTQHVCVLTALPLHNKISILSGLEFKRKKSHEEKKKLSVIVNESVVSRCLLQSLSSRRKYWDTQPVPESLVSVPSH